MKKVIVSFLALGFAFSDAAFGALSPYEICKIELESKYGPLFNCQSDPECNAIYESAYRYAEKEYNDWLNSPVDEWGMGPRVCETLASRIEYECKEGQLNKDCVPEPCWRMHDRRKDISLKVESTQSFIAQKVEEVCGRLSKTAEEAPKQTTQATPVAKPKTAKEQRKEKREQKKNSKNPELIVQPVSDKSEPMLPGRLLSKEEVNARLAEEGFTPEDHSKIKLDGHAINMNISTSSSMDSDGNSQTVRIEKDNIAGTVTTTTTENGQSVTTVEKIQPQTVIDDDQIVPAAGMAGFDIPDDDDIVIPETKSNPVTTVPQNPSTQVAQNPVTTIPQNPSTEPDVDLNDLDVNNVLTDEERLVLANQGLERIGRGYCQGGTPAVLISTNPCHIECPNGIKEPFTEERLDRLENTYCKLFGTLLQKQEATPTDTPKVEEPTPANTKPKKEKKKKNKKVKNQDNLCNNDAGVIDCQKVEEGNVAESLTCEDGEKTELTPQQKADTVKQVCAAPDREEIEETVPVVQIQPLPTSVKPENKPVTQTVAPATVVIPEMDLSESRVWYTEAMTSAFDTLPSDDAYAMYAIMNKAYSDEMVNSYALNDIAQIYADAVVGAKNAQGPERQQYEQRLQTMLETLVEKQLELNNKK